VGRIPKILSPKGHAIFDALAYPLMVALAVRMARRNRPAAAVLLVNGLVQGTTDLTTDYPAGLLRMR
jgi:hypothetical protein